MTIQRAINELFDLMHSDDIPIYYKIRIQKVIETIVMEFEDRKTEPQTDCDGCRHYADKHTADTCYECKRSYTDCYDPQAERSE